MRKKIRSVIRHEYLTIVKQPGFLLAMLGIPLLIVGAGFISYFAERSSDASIEEAASGLDNVVIVDQSGLINEEVAASLGYEVRDSGAEEVIESVQQQSIGGALVYPETLLEDRSFEAYVDSGDDFVMSTALSDVGEQLISASILAEFENEAVGNLLLMGASSDVTIFQDGEESAGVGEYIVPGAIMVIFFVILFFTMGYMLLSVSEEKENRSMEMVLTYVTPKTLITGKLLAIGLVGLTQLAFFALLGTAVFALSTRFGWFDLPFEIDPSILVFDPVSIIAGVLILAFGFLLFAAMMSGTAAIMPGTKEANSLSGVFYILAFAPFWAAQVLIAAPDVAIVKFLSFFPLTSPTTLLFRNTIGNISGLELVLAIAALAVFTALAFILAAKLFRLGALEFNDRIKLTSIFKK